MKPDLEISLAPKNIFMVAILREGVTIVQSTDPFNLTFFFFCSLESVVKIVQIFYFHLTYSKFKFEICHFYNSGNT